MSVVSFYIVYTNVIIIAAPPSITIDDDTINKQLGLSTENAGTATAATESQDKPNPPPPIYPFPLFPYHLNALTLTLSMSNCHTLHWKVSSVQIFVWYMFNIFWMNLQTVIALLSPLSNFLRHLRPTPIFNWVNPLKICYHFLIASKMPTQTHLIFPKTIYMQAGATINSLPVARQFLGFLPHGNLSETLQ